MSVTHDNGTAAEPISDSAQTLKVDGSAIEISSRRLDQRAIRVGSPLFDSASGNDLGNLERRFQELVRDTLQNREGLVSGFPRSSIKGLRIELKDREIDQRQILFPFRIG